MHVYIGSVFNPSVSLLISVPGMASSSGWPLSQVIETPLGTGFVPRAITVDADLLAGRLQRMEDTTKVYKGLVRQGLGWAKVFQRVGVSAPRWRWTR